ncbi:MAG: STAS domain-containing protein [Nitrospirae bacterium]|nr:STAS domain-containing protein [Nitrospirota bacterium]MDA1303563.1 STAS domain-containing protein [Nitrospirota bacterium]
MLTITQETQGSATVLNISGRLEFSGRKVFMDALGKAQNGSLTHLILNLQQVPYIDSAALGLMALAQQNLKLKNARVSIVNAQEYVKKVLDLANFSKIISMFPTVQDAVQSPVHA